jgi:hypothetical protein
MEGGGAVRGYADFRGAVAPEDGAVVDEGGFRSLAGGGDRGTETGETSAADDDIKIAGVRFHGS